MTQAFLARLFTLGELRKVLLAQQVESLVDFGAILMFLRVSLGYLIFSCLWKPSSMHFFRKYRPLWGGIQ
jgi:hypothetical protein